METNEFKGEIVVASRIVDYLSSGLYESPAACLKELVNNSYDADATQVDLFVKPDADRIIIADNGRGMDRADFEKHFTKISESYKREESDITELGRPKIGKIGIGFIAANEICDVMEIISTKSGTRDLLEVSIRFDLMRQDINERRRNNSDIAKADYVGKVSETDLDSHFTQVFLKNVRGEAKKILAGAGTSRYSSGKISLYGLKPESEYLKLKDSYLKTWSEFNAYSKNKLEVALNIPVPYHNNWMPPGLEKEVRDIQQQVAKLNFSVFFDGSELRKPIVFNPSGKAFISRFDFKGEYVSAHGYFYAQHGSIKPEELQGLLIRIRNAAVGSYDPTFLGYSLTRGTLFQNWISGELMADDRLEDAMNIDRKTIRIAHSAYIELQNAVHDHMENLIKRVRQEIYTAGRQIKKAEQARGVQNRIINIISSDLNRIAPEAAMHARKAWQDSTKDEFGQKKLLRKFTVDEFYELVIEVAKDSLPPQLLDKFLTLLTERLRK